MFLFFFLLALTSPSFLQSCEEAEEQDHYTVLQVPENATEDEIKKAYKKLALTNHPDKGGDEETFKKISNANDILSDSAKRSAYDEKRKNASFAAQSWRHESIINYYKLWKIDEKDSQEEIEDVLKKEDESRLTDKMKMACKTLRDPLARKLYDMRGKDDRYYSALQFSNDIKKEVDRTKEIIPYAICLSALSALFISTLKTSEIMIRAWRTPNLYLKLYKKNLITSTRFARKLFSFVLTILMPTIPKVTAFLMSGAAIVFIPKDYHLISLVGCFLACKFGERISRYAKRKLPLSIKIQNEVANKPISAEEKKEEAAELWKKNILSEQYAEKLLLTNMEKSFCTLRWMYCALLGGFLSYNFFREKTLDDAPIDYSLETRIVSDMNAPVGCGLFLLLPIWLMSKCSNPLVDKCVEKLFASSPN